MANKKRTGLWITLGIVGFIFVLLIGSLAFVELTIKNLDSSLNEKQSQVVEAFEARSNALNNLTNMLKGKMSSETKVFTELENAEKELKTAIGIKALSDANLKVDLAIDKLIFTMRDKYPYLQTIEELSDVTENIDSARSRIVMTSTGFNDVAKDYNYAIQNFPGDFLSNIFSHSETDVFQIVDYDDITD